tara:strand:+ start:1343 stop:1552 length:210 start_codon:yes stop_codon:yes gene_type:complete
MVSTATIKFTKAEIDSLIRTLTLYLKVADFFNILSKEEDKQQFLKLKEDLLNIKRELDKGEQEKINERR